MNDKPKLTRSRGHRIGAETENQTPTAPKKTKKTTAAAGGAQEPTPTTAAGSTPEPAHAAPKKPKKCSVRHTRAIQRDRTKRPTVPPPDDQIEARLTEIIHPATFNQVAHFHDLGLRERVLTLPVMMAFALSLIWRHLGSVAETVRVLSEEGLLWVTPFKVTQQAVAQRLGSLPASLFERVLNDLLPLLIERSKTRSRPITPAITRAQAHFDTIVAVDGSTLDGLLRKCGLLRGGEGPLLAGRMAALLALDSKLPTKVWYEPDSAAHDQRFWDRILAALSPSSLVVFDLGFLNFARFDQLTHAGVSFITRIQERTVSRVEKVLTATSSVRDVIVWVGSAGEHQCQQPLRLVEVLHDGKWYRYLTNVLDPRVVSSQDVMALYWQRWRIEDGFNVVKRLLGLAYFWTGSINGIQIQVWATWILYAVLVDLTDAVAEALKLPCSDISMEMVYRGLYHFTQAYHRGAATDPVAYLAEKAKLLGIVKRKRKNRSSPSSLADLTNLEDP